MTELIVPGAGRRVCSLLSELQSWVHTVLVSSGEFGGMAANDGPVPCAGTGTCCEAAS
jgi:hypothetical protein